MNKTIKLKITGIKGEKGDTPSKDELVSIITPLIPEPIKGDTGEKGESIKGDKGDKGDDGYTPIKGVDYFDGEKGERGEKGEKGDAGKDVDENVIKEIQSKVNRALDISSRDYDFKELKDVSITNPTNGQVPKYNSTTGKWENGTVNTSTPSLQEVTDVGATTTNEISIPSFQLDTTRTGDTIKGQFAWNEDKENFVYGIDSDSIEMGISVDMGVNQTGSTITKGMPVCAVGAVGASGKISIAPFIANGSIPNENFIGFAHDDILDGDTGVYITNFARIRGLNTNAWTAGTKLYPSSTVAGQYQTSAPTTWKTPIAQVINQHATNGVLAVRYSAGLKSSDLVNDTFLVGTTPSTIEKLGIGTTTIEASKLHTKESAYAYTTLTGTIVSASVSVFDVNITGSGTLFTTELKKGDILVHPTLSYAKVIITRVTSNTACSGISNGYVTGTHNTSGWRKILATEVNEDADGRRYLATNTKITSPLTGTEIVPTHLIEGDVLFQNYWNPNFGVYVRTSAVDGRMRIGHINSVSFIQFQQGNAAITLDTVVLSGLCLWTTPQLCGTTNGSNDVRLAMVKTGNGANQTIQAYAQRYAVNGDAPKYQLSANGLDFGRVAGTNWFDVIDSITLSMDKTTGNWQVGNFGTSTPAGVASRFSITDTAPNQFRVRYDGSNEFLMTVSSTGKVTFNAVGSGGEFEFLDGITAPTVNGVAVTNGGSSAKYLSEDGTYTTPSGGGGMSQAQVLTRTLGA